MDQLDYFMMVFFKVRYVIGDGRCRDCVPFLPKNGKQYRVSVLVLFSVKTSSILWLYEGKALVKQ